MTLIDVITALLVMGIFLFGFSQAFLPVYTAWNNVMEEYNAAKTIHFIFESFKNECAKQNRDMEKWKWLVSSAKELESCEITEIKKEDCLFALRAMCVIAGEQLEIIGLCPP